MVGYIIYGDGPKKPELGTCQIAGAAFWKLGLESADVWPVVERWKETMP